MGFWLANWYFVPGWLARADLKKISDESSRHRVALSPVIPFSVISASRRKGGMGHADVGQFCLELRGKRVQIGTGDRHSESIHSVNGPDTKKHG